MLTTQPYSMPESILQEKCQNIVRNDVFLDVSGCIRDLLANCSDKVDNFVFTVDWRTTIDQADRVDIAEIDNEFFWICSDTEINDESSTSFSTYDAAAKNALAVLGLDPVMVEFSEYWAVSDELAKQLQAKGEIVEFIYGWNVWGRKQQGQSIHMDYVIRDIVSQMYH